MEFDLYGWILILDMKTNVILMWVFIFHFKSFIIMDFHFGNNAHWPLTVYEKSVSCWFLG